MLVKLGIVIIVLGGIQMKKVKLGLVAVMSAAVFSGCSIMDMIAPQANGVLMYGDEAVVQQTIDQHKKEIESEAKYTVKFDKVNDQKVLIMNKTTAEKFVKEKLLRKVDGEDTKPITTLPSVSNDAGIVFAKTEQSDIVIGDKKMKYEGNVILGDARKYADMFAVVSDSAYETLSAPVKTVGVVEFKENPKKEIYPNIRKDSKLEESHMLNLKP